MLNQFHLITQAAEILDGTTGAPQERLVKGFKASCRATIANEDWPASVWSVFNESPGT